MQPLKNFDVKNQIKLSENRFNLQPQSENSKIQLTPIVMITLLTAGMMKNLQLE